MAVERYQFDEPIGLYGPYHLRHLAEGVVDDFTQYTELSEQHRQSTDLEETYSAVDEFRLSTIVAEDAPYGYALALAPGNKADQPHTEGLLYKVALRPRAQVAEVKSITVPEVKPSSDEGRPEATMKDLMTRFDRQELEAIFRMAGKLIDSLHITLSLEEIELDTPGYVERMNALSNMVRPKALLRRRSAVEPHVLRALQQYSLDDLGSLFPAPEMPTKPQRTAQSSEISHILEWNDLLDAADNLFRRESDVSLAKSAVAIQSTIDDHDYVMRFQAQYGKLSKIQLIRIDKDDHPLTQEFDLLQPQEDEDDLERLKIKPQWNKAELLRAIRQGEPITNEIYKGYLTLVATDPDCELSVGSVISLEVKRKRPAA